MAHEGKEVIWHKEQTDKATVSTELQIVGLLPSVALTIYLKETRIIIFFVRTSLTDPTLPTDSRPEMDNG